jgi:hypothetical protein
MTKYAKIMATFGVLAGLGVASLPLATFAANNSETTVKVTVQEGISIANDNATVDLGNKTPGEAGTATSKLTAATNNATGLSITVKDKDEDTSLKPTTATGSIAGIDFIPTGTSGTGTWSLKGGALTVDTAMVPASATPLTVKNTSSPSTEEVTMTYRIEPGAAQRQGTYEDVIVYTVAKN